MLAALSAFAITGTLIVLADCTGPVILRDPQTGQTVQCGPDGREQTVCYMIMRLVWRISSDIIDGDPLPCGSSLEVFNELWCSGP